MRVWLLLGVAGCGRIGFEPLGTADATTPPQLTGSVAQLAVGFSHACIRTTAGELVCWGYNDRGQLGQGAASVGTDITSPVAVGVGTTWREVAPGKHHTCALDDTGQAWCWGSAEYGELGLEAIVPGTDHPVPTMVPDGRIYKQLASGDNFTCAIASDNGVWCWGANGAQEIGVGDSTDRGVPSQVLIVPPQVGSDTDWAQIALGSDHTCAVKAGGSLWCWGANGSGQLGQAGNPTIVRSRPEVVLNTTAMYGEVHLGNDFECAREAGGSLMCLGVNASCQLGVGDTMDRDVPTTVSALPHTALDAGVSHACALRAGGELWCWGRGAEGEIGIPGVGASQPTPAQVPGTWTAISAGNDFTCAIDDASAVWCWGDGANGQLGQGTTKSSPVPVRVPGL
jgi:alpha-tubulin suppressor-like RCC1 family protein